MKKIPKNINNEDLLFIKGFTNITISKICKELKISRATLISGRYVNEEKYRMVRKELEKRIAKLYLK